MHTWHAAVVPREYFPQFARDMLDWHIAVNGDFLVRRDAMTPSVSEP